MPPESAVLTFAQFASKFFASMAGESIRQLQVNDATSTGLPSLCIKAYKSYRIALELWAKQEAAAAKE